MNQVNGAEVGDEKRSGRSPIVADGDAIGFVIARVRDWRIDARVDEEEEEQRNSEV
jgi:hypothetical protein